MSLIEAVTVPEGKRGRLSLWLAATFSSTVWALVCASLPCFASRRSTQATVVEIDPDVIALVGPHYTDPRVQIVQASAFDYQPPKGVRYGAVWHDIWDDICIDNLPEMHKLHRKYGRRADWQGSWGREIAERHR